MSLLAGGGLPAGLAPQIDSRRWPEKVIQFGEGNFLRAFVDWMFHRINQAGLFGGRVVVVQPIAAGLADRLNAQDGLYTVLLRGLRDGKPAEEREIVSSISRAINPYADWEGFLRCAENPDLRFAVSNTTEAGIAYDPEDHPEARPPRSFPGKVTVFLYHRFQHFGGAPGRGLVFLPCELIDRNGDNLRAIVLRLAEEWNLGSDFAAWVREENVFANTLVDRVVTGYPRDEIEAITASLGYRDELLDTGELFHLWVIEGPAALAEELPFTKAGLNVVWTNDMTPYRTRKVRILNGAHTGSVPAAFLCGLDTVGEMMDDPVMGKFVRQLIFEEIIPSMAKAGLAKEMLVEFAAAVVERFRNPYIRHYLSSIMLNSASKFKTRCLPSLVEYQALYGRLPERLVFSLAALTAVYRGGKIDGLTMTGRRQKGEFVMQDDRPVLEFFTAAWADFVPGPEGAQRLAQRVLGNTGLWGQDLNAVPGLTAALAAAISRIDNLGINAAAAALVKGGQ